MISGTVVVISETIVTVVSLPSMEVVVVVVVGMVVGTKMVVCTRKLDTNLPKHNKSLTYQAGCCCCRRDLNDFFDRCGD